MAATRDAYLTPASVAERLVDYVVLRHDPASPAATAGYWEMSRATYADVDGTVAKLVAEDPVASAAYRGLVAVQNDVGHHAALRAGLIRLLSSSPDTVQNLAAELAKADDAVWLDYHLGPRYQAEAAPMSLDVVLALTHRSKQPSGRRQSDETVDTHIVIPFRDDGDGMRTRNLVACLMALRDQDYQRGGWRVTVVEADERPRWRDVIEPLADRYLFAFHDGPFNKSWTVNVGVTADSRRAEFTCVLDADILTDRSFLSRNVGRLVCGGHSAHVCCRQSLSLDVPSTARSIRLRCADGAPVVSTDLLRGVLLRDAPGGSLWVRTETFHAIGGFDERFVGWGGEDEDIVGRFRHAGPFERFDDVLLHLDHPRPPMRTSDEQPFNGRVPMFTWTGQNGFGDITKYRYAVDRSSRDN